MPHIEPNGSYFFAHDFGPRMRFDTLGDVFGELLPVANQGRTGRHSVAVAASA